jgi:hypothetical protein
MQVQSPVGTFPLRITHARIAGGVPRLDAAMGAWRSEVALDRHDLPLIAAVTATLAAAFVLGRLSRR